MLFLFAWFGTSGGTAKTGTLDAQNVTVTDTSYSLGDIKFNVAMSDPSSSIVMSDTDGFAYVLVNGTPTKDARYSQNAAALSKTTKVTVTAEIYDQASTNWRAPTDDELAAVAGHYKIVLASSTGVKMSFTSATAAIADTTYTAELEFEIAANGLPSSVSAGTDLNLAVQGDYGSNNDFTGSGAQVTSALKVRSGTDPSYTWTDVAAYVAPGP